MQKNRVKKKNPQPTHYQIKENNTTQQKCQIHKEILPASFEKNLTDI